MSDAKIAKELVDESPEVEGNEEVLDEEAKDLNFTGENFTSSHMEKGKKKAEVLDFSGENSNSSPMRKDKEKTKDLDFPGENLNSSPMRKDNEKIKDSNVTGENSTFSMQEEEIIKKKYGGLLPKKPPLISKDHERAFFDSADWVLGKQGSQKNRGPLEALRPKLEPTPHHQAPSRRSAYTAIDTGEETDNGIGNGSPAAVDQTETSNGGGSERTELSEDYTTSQT